MSLVTAKAACLPIEKEMSSLLGSISVHVMPSSAKDAYQFECRAIRLQGFLMAYGAEAKQIDALSALIADCSEDPDHAPISGIFPLESVG